MYEHYITANKNGLISIDIDINEPDYWNEDGSVNNDAANVTFTFAVMTDTEAWMTIDGNGLVYVSFGGTGTTQPELDRYAKQCVQIWRAITNNHSTTCHYAQNNPNGDAPIRGDTINA